MNWLLTLFTSSRLTWTLVGSLSVVTILSAQAPFPVPGTLDELHGSLLRRDLQVHSAQSCAASNCHGGPQPGLAQPRASRGNENVLWLENDPHAQSWRTFCSDESVSMMRRLKILDAAGTVIDREGYDNCLACHNSTLRYHESRQNHNTKAPSLLIAYTRPNCQTGCDPSESMRLPSDVNQFEREGVGCASCHGPSEHWIGTHYQAGWSAEHRHDGFVAAGNLLTRARMCAACHVGDQDRDMNHDIIAAGHPPLRYEFATYHHRQPKHWRDVEADNQGTYEARLWVAGQIAAADASWSLLVTRASQSHWVSTWPELATMDCAACHQSLGFEGDSVVKNGLGGKSAPASDWNIAGLRWILQSRIRSGIASPTEQRLLVQLELIQAAIATPSPDANELASLARGGRDLIAAWVFSGEADQVLNADPESIKQFVVLAAGDASTFGNWESTTQFYLAAVAARHGWPGGFRGPAKTDADSLAFGLNYREGIDVHTTEQLSKSEAMRRGLTLAAWLGPVVMPEIPEDADADAMERLQAELEETIRNVKERTRSTEPRRSADPSVKPKADTPPPDPTKPNETLPPKKLSREELLERLRQRNREAEDNPFNDDAGKP